MNNQEVVNFINEKLKAGKDSKTICEEVNSFVMF